MLQSVSPPEYAEAAEAAAQAAETLSPEVKRDLAIPLDDTDDVVPECVGGVAGVGVSVGVQVGGVVEQRPARSIAVHLWITEPQHHKTSLCQWLNQ